ncbi:hypothetical protein LPJ66_009584, partial [Kickxella alabastrina]
MISPKLSRRESETNTNDGSSDNDNDNDNNSPSKRFKAELSPINNNNNNGRSSPPVSILKDGPVPEIDIPDTTNDRRKSRKSIGRRVSFAPTAHVRMFDIPEDKRLATPQGINTFTMPDISSQTGIIGFNLGAIPAIEEVSMTSNESFDVSVRQSDPSDSTHSSDISFNNAAQQQSANTASGAGSFNSNNSLANMLGDDDDDENSDVSDDNDLDDDAAVTMELTGTVDMGAINDYGSEDDDDDDNVEDGDVGAEDNRPTTGSTSNISSLIGAPPVFSGSSDTDNFLNMLLQESSNAQQTSLLENIMSQFNSTQNISTLFNQAQTQNLDHTQNITFQNTVDMDFTRVAATRDENHGDEIENTIRVVDENDSHDDGEDNDDVVGDEDNDDDEESIGYDDAVTMELTGIVGRESESPELPVGHVLQQETASNALRNYNARTPFRTPTGPGYLNQQPAMSGSLMDIMGSILDNNSGIANTVSQFASQLTSPRSVARPYIAPNHPTAPRSRAAPDTPSPITPASGKDAGLAAFFSRFTATTPPANSTTESPFYLSAATLPIAAAAAGPVAEPTEAELVKAEAQAAAEAAEMTEAAAEAEAQTAAEAKAAAMAEAQTAVEAQTVAEVATEAQAAAEEAAMVEVAAAADAQAAAKTQVAAETWAAEAAAQALAAISPRARISKAANKTPGQRPPRSRRRSSQIHAAQALSNLAKEEEEKEERVAAAYPTASEEEGLIEQVPKAEPVFELDALPPTPAHVQPPFPLKSGQPSLVEMAKAGLVFSIFQAYQKQSALPTFSPGAAQLPTCAAKLEPLFHKAKLNARLEYCTAMSSLFEADSAVSQAADAHPTDFSQTVLFFEEQNDLLAQYKDELILRVAKAKQRCLQDAPGEDTGRLASEIKELRAKLAEARREREAAGAAAEALNAQIKAIKATKSSFGRQVTEKKG